MTEGNLKSVGGFVLHDARADILPLRTAFWSRLDLPRSPAMVPEVPTRRTSEPNLATWPPSRGSFGFQMLLELGWSNVVNRKMIKYDKI